MCDFIRSYQTSLQSPLPAMHTHQGCTGTSVATIPGHIWCRPSLPAGSHRLLCSGISLCPPCCAVRVRSDPAWTVKHVVGGQMFCMEYSESGLLWLGFRNLVQSWGDDGSVDRVSCNPSARNMKTRDSWESAIQRLSLKTISLRT